MLAFLRRYQRYFLWVITVMIVVSFSFFGTYGVMEQRLPTDPIALHTVDGREVRQSQLRAMMDFLSNDMVDTFLGSGKGNVFNDGVIANDFLQTSLGLQLAESFSADIKPDLQSRFIKERRAQFYHHPQAPFLSSETVWEYFIPETTKNLATLRQGVSPVDPEVFRARMQLYTAQRALPPQELKRILLHQEKQYEWLDHDPNLEYTDLSMFGYHNAEDWFGPQYIRVVSEFILNAAAIAQQRGYEVTAEEAMADLMQQVEKAYKRIPPAQSPAVSWQVYFEQQLARLGLNEAQLVETWRDILLFRRLFDGVGHALFLDPLSFEDFSRYALTRIEGFNYALPSELWIPSESVLQKFETYLALVAEKMPENPLALPSRWKKPQDLLKQYPELVQKRYRVAVSEVTSRHLQAQVGLQEMWDWQTDSNNWAKLAQEFPEIAIYSAKTPEERLSVLDGLSKSSRARIDSITRSKLVSLHSEWLDKALKQAPVRTEVWVLPFAGKSKQMPDVEHSETLIALLGEAPVGEEPLLPALARYSPNGDTFYRIRLLEQPSALEVVPFGTAKNAEVLAQALKKRLETYWMKVRDAHPDLFRQDNGSWRTFEESQGAVADLYFQPLFDALQREYQTHEGALGRRVEEAPSRNLLSAFRLYQYVQSVAEQVESPSGQEKGLVRFVETPTPEKGNLALDKSEVTVIAQPVQDQFLLIKTAFRSVRRDSEKNSLEEKLFNIQPGDWSKLFATPNGSINFFHVLETGVENTTATILEQMNQVQGVLKQEAQALLMKNVLRTMLLKDNPPFSRRETADVKGE